MEVWFQQDFQPVAQDDEGNDLYGYFCVVPVNEQEGLDLFHFFEEHGIPIDWDDTRQK